MVPYACHDTLLCTHSMHGNAILRNERTPLVVLVDQNTASAAEVFAAALQDNSRAKLVGKKTFGKGVIQTLQPLNSGGVAVTIARYETPAHRNINLRGIEVDVPLDCAGSPSDLDSTKACLVNAGESGVWKQ